MKYKKNVIVPINYDLDIPIPKINNLFDTKNQVYPENEKSENKNFFQKLKNFNVNKTSKTDNKDKIIKINKCIKINVEDNKINIDNNKIIVKSFGDLDK